MTKEELEKLTMEWKNNYILKLEKENAELKERIKTLEQIKREHTDYTIKVEEERTFVKDQLTKAKGIIREFVEWATWQGSNCPNFKSIQDKAEQFLKDCDIDNAIQQANKGLDFDKIADEMEQDLKDSEVQK